MLPKTRALPEELNAVSAESFERASRKVTTTAVNQKAPSAQTSEPDEQVVDSGLNSQHSTLLSVNNLETRFFTRAGVVRAVDRVSFVLSAGRTLALVGESGSGKSMTALSVMRLVPPPGRVVGGEVIFEGRNLLDLPPNQMRRVRGRQIAMIFQDPMTSLNPVYTVGEQIAEAIRLHEGLPSKAAAMKAVEMLHKVRIPEPARRSRDYPHQLSGGMRQRVMIAMALSCNPRLLIADEPTTALDVTIQAEILRLLARLKEEFHIAMLLITHDLGIVAEVADSVTVMYAGQVVEDAPVHEIFTRPRHPYTAGLLQSIPRLSEGETRRRLPTIEGSVPGLIDIPPGCRFAARCPYRRAECTEGAIPLLEPTPHHHSRCILAEEPEVWRLKAEQ
jgi:oligopeptide/dipeptide ABC transporter ATP-binding protein